MAFKPRRFRQFRGPAQEPAALAISGNAEPHADRLDPSGGATLLELARERWQLGDWAALVSIPATALQRSPDPGRLALMVASAHLQLGQREPARQFLQRATDWGVDRRLVAQTLIAGLHDTLGRAASLQGDAARAQTHFTAALALAAPARLSVSAARARASAQMQALAALAVPSRRDTPIAQTTTLSPASARHWTIEGRPRHLGPARQRHPWATAWPVGNGGWLIAWAGAHQTVMLQALDAAADVTAERELSLGDGDHGAVEPCLAQDARGHWLLLWPDSQGQPRWRRSAEPSDLRPWSATRHLPCPAPASHLDVLSANGSTHPALALATGAGAPLAAWRFDERRCDWHALDLPDDWPGAAMALTLHTDARHVCRLLGWELDVSGRPAALWSSRYDTELARWRRAQRLDLGLSTTPQVVPRGAALSVDHAMGTWVRAVVPSEHLFFRDGQSQWWRLRPEVPAAEPLAGQTAWQGTPIAGTGELWRGSRHDARPQDPGLGDGLGDGVGDATGVAPRQRLGRPLALAATAPPGSRAILLSQADDATGGLLLTRLIC